MLDRRSVLMSGVALAATAVSTPVLAARKSAAIKINDKVRVDPQDVVLTRLMGSADLVDGTGRYPYGSSLRMTRKRRESVARGFWLEVVTRDGSEHQTELDGVVDNEDKTVNVVGVRSILEALNPRIIRDDKWFRA